MAARPNESLYPWEQAVEQRYCVDFLFRTDVQSIIDTYPAGADYHGWPHVYRVMLALRDVRGLTSVFGRRYRKRMFIQPCGGGIEAPVWWFDVAGRVPESHGYDPPIIRYIPGSTTDLGGGWFQVNEWAAENVIEQ